MDYEKESRLWALCIEQYGRLRMGGFENWVDDYPCPDEEKRYLLETREYLRMRNSTGLTRVDSLQVYSSLRDFKTHTFQLSQARGIPQDIRENLRIRFEQIDFNTFHQQS